MTVVSLNVIGANQKLQNFKNKSVGLKMTINNNNIIRIFENFITSNIVLTKLDENEIVALG